MKIYKPRIRYFYPLEDYPLLKKGEKIELSETDDAYYSTEEKAINFLKNQVSEIDDEYKIVEITIEVIVIDTDNKNELYYYNHELKNIGKFDFDKKYSQAQYKKNEWVLFIHNQDLKIGLIGEECKGTEPYYVVFENMELNDDSPHAHLDELFIIETISEKRAEKLLPSKYFYNIKRRNQEFSKEK